ncbi:hypothetical protein LDENG_00193920, partial [Lucifuga dentata]
HQEFLLEVVIPEHSQEIQSLLCLPNSCCGVNAPGQVILYVDAQEPKPGDPLYTVPTDEQGLHVHCFPPEVHYHLLCLCGVQDQVIVFAPH